MNKMVTPFHLREKTVIITGASSGIGRETAITCSRMGADIILVDLNQNGLQETLVSLTPSDAHKQYTLDLTDHQAVETMVRAFKSNGTVIHGLVHAAGISTTLPIKLTSPEKMEKFFQVNTISGFNLARLMLQHRIQSIDGMSMLFIASVMSVVGEKGKTLYGMTKGAVVAGAKSLAMELASKKIRVNSISPGVVKTPLSGKSVYSQDENMLRQITELHPLGLGEPEDVAYACVYLLSDASRWITGTNLVIDGGYVAR